MKPYKQILDALIGKCRWNEIYDSEEELVSDLMKSGNYQRKGTKGYVYLESFKKTVADGKELSAKQMIQLKRLSREVYINVHDSDVRNTYWL